VKLEDELAHMIVVSGISSALANGHDRDALYDTNELKTVLRSRIWSSRAIPDQHLVRTSAIFTCGVIAAEAIRRLAAATNVSPDEVLGDLADLAYRLPKDDEE
jgi:hypothetical protein